MEREYCRQEETQRPWPFRMLCKPVDGTADHPFFRLKNFQLNHHDGIQFPDSCMASVNYFNPKWKGLRRIKNVVVVMEYAPDASATVLRLRTKEDMDVHLSERQEEAPFVYVLCYSGKP